MQKWNDVSHRVYLQQPNKCSHLIARFTHAASNVCLLLLTTMMTKAHTRPGQASALFRRLPNEPWSGFGFGNYDSAVP
jgi:hypothetical protein